MIGRRETRRESEALMARREGLGHADRQRLLQEHRAFFAGDRATDADFSTVAPQRLMAGRVPRPAGSPPRPSTGKIAAYRNLLEEEYSETGGKKRGKRLAVQSAADSPAKKLSKKEQARQAREEKFSKEARAVARAAGAANQKKLAKMKEQHRLEMDEKRGAIAPGEEVDEDEEDEEDDDADDESEISLSEGDVSSVASPDALPAESPRRDERVEDTPTPSRTPVRTLDLSASQEIDVTLWTLKRRNTSRSRGTKLSGALVS
ncbi:hypothetical protein F442_01150 [Phytophthora nicotianae P10297]|uniref:Uncharacterized protein n=1 Tax=Phytophthora nicotianae P10297 TaxID=1317064 RepID=W3A353_PHYNI|nr:hypothetical protein F442_01150 [Phytophthora nicotianae P10297]